MVLLLVGVHHGAGLGDALLGAVVVGDHHVHAQLPGAVHLRHRGNAVVHGDNQGDALLVECLHGVEVHAVALPLPLGYVIHHVGAHGLQVGEQDGGGGDAVGVVVAIDGDSLKALNGAVDALHRLVHVLHQKGVGKLPAGEQVADFPLLRKAPYLQEHGEEKGQGIPLRDLGRPLPVERGHLPLF